MKAEKTLEERIRSAVDSWYSCWKKVDGGEKADLIRRLEEALAKAQEAAR